MTRLIAGVAGGRRLAAPPGRGTRPTSDRAREGLFSALASLCGDLAGLRVLDLYAGSGAVGLEALSRGAAQAWLVESDPRAASVIRANAAEVGLAGAQVLAEKVERFAAAPREPGRLGPDVAFDVVFLDPPYAVADADVRAVLAALAAGGVLAPDAVVVVERGSRSGAFDWPSGFVGLRSRRYGEATLWYGRAAPPDAVEDGRGRTSEE